MRDFLEKIEKFLVNFIILGLILLISLQLIMKNDSSYQRLKDFEYSFRSGFQDNQAIEVSTGVQNYEETRLFADSKLLINVLEEDYLPQVWLVKNGERISDFSTGSVEIDINDGDFLLIDSRFYDGPLLFEIEELSPNIRTWHTGQEFRLFVEEKKLGLVEFYDKL